MTVQELFKKLDKKDIVDSYMFIYGYDAERAEAKMRTAEENIKAVRRERELVELLVDYIRLCKAKTNEEKNILFAIPEKETFYEDKDDPAYISTFYVPAERAIKMMSAPDWKDEDIYEVEHYAYDFVPTEEVVGYEVAKTALKYIEPLIITADILEELSFFGYDPDYRMQRIEEVKKELEASVEEIKKEEGSVTTADDLWAELYQAELDDCKTEDERQHIILEHEFQEKTEAIQRRYADQVMSESEQVMLQFFKEEFGRGKTTV